MISLNQLLVGPVARLPWRVQTKLLAAFLAIVALLILLGAIGLYELSAVDQRTEELIGSERKIAAYRQVQHDTTSQLYSVTSALLVSDDRTLDSALRQLNQFGYDLERLQFVAQDEIKLLGKVREEYDRFIAVATRVLELIRSGKKFEAIETQTKESRPLASRLERLTNELVKVLPTLTPVMRPVVGTMLGLNRGDGEVIATMPGRAPATPFNKPITPHRRLAFRSVDLNTVKAVKNAFGVSVNDVVMAMCAGALRRWLADREALPSHPLIAMIPVSVRDPASKGALGNKVSAMLATLPTSVSDPGLRVEVVHAATRIAKAQQAAIPQGLVDQISDFAPPALTARAARVVFATGVLHRLPAFNLTISNVPGPNVPVYLCGAKMIAHYPVSVVTDGQGLNITLVGYLGQLHFGLVACRELVPDIDVLAGYLVDELALLVEAAEKRTAEQTHR